MVEVGAAPSSPEFRFLPPANVRLLDPTANRGDHRLPTPLDERGLVDISALIILVNSTVHPRHRWSRPSNEHHLYWEEDWYARDDDELARVNPAYFRDIAPNKIWAPMEWQNWLHAVTIPPPVPDTEVMALSVQAWEVAEDLFYTAQNIVWWEKRRRNRRLQLARDASVLKPEFDGQDVIGEGILDRILAAQHRGLDRNIQAFADIPRSYWLTDPTKPFRRVASHLGSIVSPGHRVLTTATQRPLGLARAS